MRRTKLILMIVIAIILMLFVFLIHTEAVEETIEIVLDDGEILVNGESISSDNNSDYVYLSSQMSNGGTSSEAIEANIEIENIINIVAAGTYEFTGSLTDGQISINANEIDGDVVIILNNVDITCENAPAIFVYDQDLESSCNVTIRTKLDSTNTISGGKIKTSVQDWEDQENILYYIEKGNDDDGTYYERYKYDGAISSDVSLIFEGEGELNVVGLAKEGIESKGNITFDSGNVVVDSEDDSINACSDHESIITINDGLVVARVSSEAEEGDGIDSNGSIVINGGVVYAFACPGSDNGLDSDDGIQINGGEVFSIGSMYEDFSAGDGVTLINLQLEDTLNSETVVAVWGEEEEVGPFFATILDREAQVISYASDTLDIEEEYSIYADVEIDGETNEYGIYTRVTSASIDNATLLESSTNGEFGGKTFNEIKKQMIEEDDESYVIEGVLLVLVAILLFVIIITVEMKYESNPKALNIFLGLVIGVTFVSGIYMIMII